MSCQAEQLVQMICYPGGLPSVQLGDDDDDDDEPKQRYQIGRILHSVDQWSQRVSWLELQLMIKQALSSVSFCVFVFFVRNFVLRFVYLSLSSV